MVETAQATDYLSKFFEEMGPSLYADARNQCQSLIDCVRRIQGLWSQDTAKVLMTAIEVLGFFDKWHSSIPLEELKVPISSLSTAFQALQTFLNSCDLNSRTLTRSKCMGILLNDYRLLLACYIDSSAVYFCWYVRSSCC